MKGHYHLNCLPQGFNSSMAIFQKEIDTILNPLSKEGVGAYVDDIFVFFESFEQYLTTINKLL